MWMQYPPPPPLHGWFVSVSSFVFHGHVSRSRYVRFPLGCVPLGWGYRPWSCGWGTSRCVALHSWLSLFLAMCILPRAFLHAHRFCVVASSARTKHPVRSDKHLFSWPSWSPSTDAGCVAPVMDVFASSPITWGMGVRPPHSPFVFCSSSLVFVGEFVCKRSAPCPVSPRECPSSCITRTLVSHSRMLIRVRACVNRSTTHTPHLPHDCPTRHG